MPDELVETNDVVCTLELAEIFGLLYAEEIADLRLRDRHQTCAGEWRLEPDDRWRFWLDAEADAGDPEAERGDE